MKNLSFENLEKDVETFILAENDSYIESYSEFINYFKNIDWIEKHHLVIASHFVYGWMPTIIQLDTKNIDEVLATLNGVKAGHYVTENQLEIIKQCVNNSMVGTSKLLHFINPELYAIWDSRIFRYLTGKKSSYGIDKPKAYLKYLEGMKEIANHKDYRSLHFAIERNFKYEISPMRAIEILMFETDRERQRKKNNNSW
jgi:hypothetical protein